jgi:PKD repeat protein
MLRDTKTYGADVKFFPGPNPYVPGDNLGTDVVWINQSPIAPPVVNFTASTTNGASPLPVTFTYTGSGSPSLVEWDFTGDGIYDATGLVTAGANYGSPGTYMVRCRATNASGQDILTRPTYITVT